MKAYIPDLKKESVKYPKLYETINHKGYGDTIEIKDILEHAGIIVTIKAFKGVPFLTLAPFLIDCVKLVRKKCNNETMFDLCTSAITLYAENRVDKQFLQVISCEIKNSIYTEFKTADMRGMSNSMYYDTYLVLDLLRILLYAVEHRDAISTFFDELMYLLVKDGKDDENDVYTYIRVLLEPYLQKSNK